MIALTSRTARTLVATVVAGASIATVTAAPAAADPARVVAGPLSLDRAALPGWEIMAPDADGTVVAGAQLTGKNWGSQIEFGPSLVKGQSSEAVARTIVTRSLESDGYKGLKGRVVGVQVTPTTISGVPATRALAEVQFDGAPVRADRLRVIVVDTKPQTYYLSAVPVEAPDRQAQAEAAERSLIAAR